MVKFVLSYSHWLHSRYIQWLQCFCLSVLFLQYLAVCKCTAQNKLYLTEKLVINRLFSLSCSGFLFLEFITTQSLLTLFLYREICLGMSRTKWVKPVHPSLVLRMPLKNNDFFWWHFKHIIAYQRVHSKQIHTKISSKNLAWRCWLPNAWSCVSETSIPQNFRSKIVNSKSWKKYVFGKRLAKLRFGFERPNCPIRYTTMYILLHTST